jgi:putative SOS response-associated peptidase YedK
MCSNFNNVTARTLVPRLSTPLEHLFDGAAHLETMHAWPKRPAAVIRASDDGDWRIDEWRWSLVPFWSDTPEPGISTFNARSETVHRAPAFRGPWRHGQRCLIPLTSWYESGKALARKGWVKITPAAPAITFAGIWDTWTDKETRDALHSFSMLTTSAAPSMAHVHDRMPVIIPARYRKEWLDPETTPETARRMLHPVEDDFSIQLPD